MKFSATFDLPIYQKWSNTSVDSRPKSLKALHVRLALSTLSFFLIFWCPLYLNAQDAVNSGEFIVEPPTLTNLGFEWYIEGDYNRNATVAVAYRWIG